MSTSLPVGTLLVGNNATYKVLKQLGQGGFGITYLTEAEVKANGIPFKLKFAVKEHFIKALCERDGNTTKVRYSSPVANEVNSSLRAFVREAQRVGSLGIDNPNIVKISEVFEANNTAYYAMEYLEGETLDDRIARKGKLSVEETLAMMQPICIAVAQMHANRLTHYDIKPMNIIIARDRESGEERPVLIDFGLSKHYNEEGKATSTLSQGGYSQGYSPVEQYGGLSDYSPQSDVYSLAATMYHCLTGNVLPIAYAVHPQSVNEDLASLDVPENIRHAICHALDIQREQRPADAGAFINELFGQANVGLHHSAAAGSNDHSAAAESNGQVQGRDTTPITIRPNKEQQHSTEQHPYPNHAPDPDETHLLLKNSAKSKKPWIIAAAVAAVLLVAGLIVFLVNRGGDDHTTGPNDTMLVAQLDDQLVIEEQVIERGVLDSVADARTVQTQQQDQQQQQQRTTTIPSQPDGYINGHGYVDMGGNMGRWGWCNVGASSPTDYGDYYAWGEISTTPDNDYSSSNCRLYGQSWGDIGGDPLYDSSTANWESCWRLPTEQQYRNLKAGCNRKTRTINGVKGMLFTSKANGKTLFFPFGNERGDSTSSYWVGSRGLFWTSSPCSDTKYAYHFCVDSYDNCGCGYSFRCFGRSIRAVLE